MADDVHVSITIRDRHNRVRVTTHNEINLKKIESETAKAAASMASAFRKEVKRVEEQKEATD